MEKETTETSRLRPEDYKFNNKVLSWLGRIPIYGFVPIMYALYMLTLYPIMSLYEHFHQIPTHTLKELGFVTNPLLDCVGTIVFTPLIETAFFQLLPFYFLNLFGFFRKHKWLILLIPSVVFGLIHTYDSTYQFITGIMGIFFMLSYILRFYRKDAFLSTVLLHALINTVAVMVHYLHE